MEVVKAPTFISSLRLFFALVPVWWVSKLFLSLSLTYLSSSQRPSYLRSEPAVKLFSSNTKPLKSTQQQQPEPLKSTQQQQDLMLKYTMIREVGDDFMYCCVSFPLYYNIQIIIAFIFLWLDMAKAETESAKEQGHECQEDDASKLEPGQGWLMLKYTMIREVGDDFMYSTRRRNHKEDAA